MLEYDTRRPCIDATYLKRSAMHTHMYVMVGINWWVLYSVLSVDPLWARVCTNALFPVRRQLLDVCCILHLAQQACLLFAWFSNTHTHSVVLILNLQVPFSPWSRRSALTPTPVSRTTRLGMREVRQYAERASLVTRYISTYTVVVPYRRALLQ